MRSTCGGSASNINATHTCSALSVATTFIKCIYFYEKRAGRAFSHLPTRAKALCDDGLVPS
eukprot:2375361-Pleurochrysis_carterae.AAC.1